MSSSDHHLSEKDLVEVKKVQKTVTNMTAFPDQKRLQHLGSSDEKEGTGGGSCV